MLLDIFSLYFPALSRVWPQERFWWEEAQGQVGSVFRLRRWKTVPSQVEERTYQKKTKKKNLHRGTWKSEGCLVFW